MAQNYRVISLLISNEAPLDRSTCFSNMCHPVIHCLREPPTQFNTLRLRQNGRHFPDNIFKCIFLNENVWISIDISLKFFPKDQIKNIPALVQIMAWHQPGNKPLSEPMMVYLTNTYASLCLTELTTSGTKRSLTPIWFHFTDDIYHLPCSTLAKEFLCISFSLSLFWTNIAMRSL